MRVMDAMNALLEEDPDDLPEIVNRLRGVSLAVCGVLSAKEIDQNLGALFGAVNDVCVAYVQECAKGSARVGTYRDVLPAYIRDIGLAAMSK